VACGSLWLVACGFSGGFPHPAPHAARHPNPEPQPKAKAQIAHCTKCPQWPTVHQRIAHQQRIKSQKLKAHAVVHSNSNPLPSSTPPARPPPRAPLALLPAHRQWAFLLDLGLLLIETYCAPVIRSYCTNSQQHTAPCSFVLALLAPRAHVLPYAYA
jgi:hypothetical protein